MATEQIEKAPWLTRLVPPEEPPLPPDAADAEKAEAYLIELLREMPGVLAVEVRPEYQLDPLEFNVTVADEDWETRYAVYGAERQVRERHPRVRLQVLVDWQPSVGD